MAQGVVRLRSVALRIVLVGRDITRPVGDARQAVERIVRALQRKRLTQRGKARIQFLGTVSIAVILKGRRGPRRGADTRRSTTEPIGGVIGQTGLFPLGVNRRNLVAIGVVRVGLENYTAPRDRQGPAEAIH